MTSWQISCVVGSLEGTHTHSYWGFQNLHDCLLPEIGRIWSKPAFAHLFMTTFIIDRPYSLWGKMELLWLFGPPLDKQGEWSVMPVNLALQLEASFDSGKTQMYCEIGYYVYDFCSMTQLNSKVGTKRPIKRLIVYH